MLIEKVIVSISRKREESLYVKLKHFKQNSDKTKHIAYIYIYIYIYIYTHIHTIISYLS